MTRPGIELRSEDQRHLMSLLLRIINSLENFFSISYKNFFHTKIFSPGDDLWLKLIRNNRKINNQTINKEEIFLFDLSLLFTFIYIYIYI